MATQTFEVHWEPGLGANSLKLPLVLYGASDVAATVTLSEVGSLGIYRGTLTGTLAGCYSAHMTDASDVFQSQIVHFRVRNASETFRGRTFPFELVNEPTAVPAWGTSLEELLAFVVALSRNPNTQTASEFRLRNAADSATIGSRAVSDDGTTLEQDVFA